ncbi:hypothetical protein PtA15_11A311 [Puccinia triticina]|uniref:Uncharacterized protein n=1 Tax=Puccinia triticina TaxID=208348 RepID=A0ABY7CZU5_9BASI|nr:uncharacterized protein PtA15_11A311 [Puccinia triticina]WAQ89621.1 hypothetical protein PtA15_11A311 [Puccinia triticina]
MFTSSNTAYTDVQNLFHIWTTQGIQIPCGRVCRPPVTSPAPPSIKPSKKPVSATFLALASKKASNSLLPDISDLLGRSKPSPDVPDVSAETSDPPEVKKPVLLKFKLKLQPQDLPKVLPPPTVMSPNLAPLNNSVWPAKKGKVLPCPPPQDTWAT